MASKKSNQDAFNRMNFLYQAANMCIKMPTEQSVRMAAYYGMLLRGVGKKAQARMDPGMKRTLCKGCHTVLVPGVTATVKLQKKPASRVVWLCKCCSTIKRFNLRKDYKIWVEQTEAVVGQTNNKAENCITDKSATGTANKINNVKNNGNTQNKTTAGITVNTADLVGTAVTPADKLNEIVNDIKLCDAGPSNKIKLCDVDSADKLNDSVSDIRLCDSHDTGVDNIMDVDSSNIMEDAH